MKCEKYILAIGIPDNITRKPHKKILKDNSLWGPLTLLNGTAIKTIT